MSYKTFAPEQVISLSSGAVKVPIPDDSLIIIGAHFETESDPEDTRTPEKRYTDRHRFAMLHILAGADVHLPTTQELQHIQSQNNDRWKRIHDAATRWLGSHGYFPPLAELYNQSNIIAESPLAELIPLQRTAAIEISQNAALREIA